MGDTLSEEEGELGVSLPEEGAAAEGAPAESAGDEAADALSAFGSSTPAGRVAPAASGNSARALNSSASGAAKG